MGACGSVPATAGGRLGGFARLPAGAPMSRPTEPAPDAPAETPDAERRARQQTVVADLAQLVLGGAALDAVFGAAVEQTAAVLGAPLAEVLRHEPDEGVLRVVAGVGWRPGVVGVATVPGGPGSPADVVLRSPEPVFVADVAAPPLAPPPLLAEHHVRSGVGVRIAGAADAPYGLFSVHHTVPDAFGEADRVFVKTVALVLGSAVSRDHDRETIRQQVADLEAVYAQAPVGLAVLDADLRYVRVNDRLARSNARAASDHVGRAVPECAPGVADALGPVLRAALASGVGVDGLEFRSTDPTRDGDECVWLYSVQPRLGPDGRATGLTLAVLDVTERARTRDALAESAASLDLALAGGGLGTWSIDLVAGVGRYDWRCQEMLGVPPEIAVADALARVHSEDRDRVAGVLAAASDPTATDPTFAAEYRYVHPDGSVVWSSTSGRTVFEGEGADRRAVALVGVAFDVTAQKEAEATVRNQLAQIEAYFEAVPVGIAILDADHRYVRVNQRLADLSGRAAESLVGLPAQEVNPAYGATLRPYVERVLSTGVPLLNHELRIASGSDPTTDLDWLVSYVPVAGEPAPDGAPAAVQAVSVVVQDVTPLKRAQAALEALTDALEARVAERTRQVRRLSADLTQAEQGERRRVAQILHDDLQQLLYALQLKVQILGRTVSGDAGPLVASLDALLGRAIDTTRSLTVDLSPPVLAGEGVDRSLEWLALRMADGYGLHTTVRAEGDTRAAPDVQTLLFQLVRELLFNVVKHSGSAEAAVAVRRLGGRLRIDVTDAGSGFDPATLDGERRDGFGLFSVRERLHFIGGSMRIASSPAGGTTVTIEAPADP
jgi:PAS domain S-box-containing protein